MRLTTGFATLAAVAGLATFTPSSAQAISSNCFVAPTVTIGFGGFFNGCYAGFTITRLFENAGNNNDIYYFIGDPGQSGANNAPVAPNPALETAFLFNSECGSTGNTDFTGLYCGPTPQTTGPTRTITWNEPSELVFGLRDPSLTWIYSGTDASRNDPPMPAGIQNFLWDITDSDAYLFGWEDLNTSCLNSDTVPLVTSAQVFTENTLSQLFATCNPAVGFSDRDYNDLFMLITPIFADPPSETVPEPMTMTLMATGLVGLAAARRRNRKS